MWVGVLPLCSEAVGIFYRPSQCNFPCHFTEKITHTCIYIYIYNFFCVSEFVYVSVYIYIYIYIYVCVCVYVCERVYKYFYVRVFLCTLFTSVSFLSFLTCFSFQPSLTIIISMRQCIHIFSLRIVTDINFLKKKSTTLQEMRAVAVLS